MVYPGGKNNVYHKIINLIPPHRVYIETHAGSAAIARYKRPAYQTVLIDRDPKVIKALSAGIANSGEVGLSGWSIVKSDAVAWLHRYQWRGDEFIYADPPYVMSARRQHRPIYRYEYTDRQHKDLLDCLKSLPCMVMISGYWSQMYAAALEDWQVVTFEAITRGGSVATEYLWMNYPEPTVLHDYNYLGDDFRERERIKRKITRWVNRLESLPEVEKNAILAALTGSYST